MNTRKNKSKRKLNKLREKKLRAINKNRTLAHELEAEKKKVGKLVKKQTRAEIVETKRNIRELEYIRDKYLPNDKGDKEVSK